MVRKILLYKRDVAVFWATEQGRSLCNQIPAIIADSAGIADSADASANHNPGSSSSNNKNHHKFAFVVSPLISFMQDQVHKLNGRGGGASGSGSCGPGSTTASVMATELATYLGAGRAGAAAAAEQRALAGEHRLVYLTPEKLLSGSFLDRLAQLHATQQNGAIAIIAIDEAHSVTEWGSAYRP